MKMDEQKPNKVRCCVSLLSTVVIILAFLASIASCILVIHMSKELHSVKLTADHEITTLKHQNARLQRAINDHHQQLYKIRKMLRISETSKGSTNMQAPDKSKNVTRVKRTAVEGTNEVLTAACLQGPPGRDGRGGRDGPQGPPGTDGITAKELQQILTTIQAKGNTDESVYPVKAQGNSTESSVYVRWGRSTCPQTASLVYNGVAAGSHYSHTGGGAQKLCLPNNPQWGTYKDGFKDPSYITYIYGAEYQVYDNKIFSEKNANGASLHDHDVPCAVCHTTRATQLMIPGWKDCPAKWTKEYNGYLTAERFNHQRSSFDCMDEAPEVSLAGNGDQNGALFYLVEAKCGSLPCPNYVDGREMTCVVCTK